MQEPAHKILIDRFLDWERAKQRLDRYKHIGAVYEYDDLRKCSSKAPFYCHYLAWRLGTWEDEQWFEYLDYLIASSMELKGWNNDRVPKGCEFENFWSFVWELAVAVFFRSQAQTIVEWTKSGPDLRVIIEENEFYVECTTYRKSFGLEEFIDGILRRIHPELAAEHAPCIRFSLPKDDAIEKFLDELFKPFLVPGFLENKLAEAKQRSPIIFPLPEGTSNFYVYLTAKEAAADNLYQPWHEAGDPEEYFEVAVREVLGNKKSSNKLQGYHPNLLAVNFLLGIDFQLAAMIRGGDQLVPILDKVLSQENSGFAYDGIFLTACGIDELPSFDRKSFISIIRDHPIRSIIPYPQPSKVSKL